MLRDNPNPADEDEEWQDVEVSEEWGNFWKLLFSTSIVIIFQKNITESDKGCNEGCVHTFIWGYDFILL